ncbi:hypothetical protein [Streptomyces crystallinus]|uniref:TrbC/VIRB2 family protein n=1 Tax=Streptomyces crystallinus TaxID=68191 RepID=A0ABP3RUA0_9ACTN
MALSTAAVILCTSSAAVAADPKGGDGPAISTTGLTSWIQNNVINLGLLTVGAVIIFRGKSKDWSGALVTGAIAIFGLLFVSLGTGTDAGGIGDWLLSLLGVTKKA